MTLTIDLPDEIVAALKTQAAAQGLSLEAWLLQIAEQHAQGRPHIADLILENMRDVPPEELLKLPTDGASQHDHYIYGLPKRNQ